MPIDAPRLAEGFWRAAYGEIAWDDAAAALSTAMGGRFAHLALFDSQLGMRASILAQATTADLRDFATHQVGSAQVNPRVNATLAARPGRCVVDDDFLSPAERDRIPFYRDFLRPTGTDHATILRSDVAADGMWVALSIVGPDRLIAATAAGRRSLETLFPSLTDAVRLAMRFGAMQTDALVAALDQEDRACIALDAQGGAVAISAGAEQILASARYLTVRNGRIRAATRRSDDRLAQAIDRFGPHFVSGSGRIPVLLEPHDAIGPPIVAALAPVPSRGMQTLSRAVALLTLPAPAPSHDLIPLLAEAFGLSRTEAVIAVAIADGQSPAEIATLRNLSRETVRTHLRNIMAKTDTHRQSGLSALIRRMAG